MHIAGLSNLSGIASPLQVTPQGTEAMSDIVEAAVRALAKKIGHGGFDGVAKFEIRGEGTIIVDSDGARAGDGTADVTLTADVETFQAILEGHMNPTAAFMHGDLAVDGDMSVAIRLGSAIA